jgi:hypothetical protein
VQGRAVTIDGDTFAIGGEKVRILDIDTPESFQSRCEQELVLADNTRVRSAFDHLFRLHPVAGRSLDAVDAA